jgi:5-methylcytosine-specific restriction endonuclease McrA
MTYSEKLKDPRWKSLRKKIIARDNGECKICGLDEELHVHHGYYAKGLSPWEYEHDSLHTLCSYCHERVHDSISRIHRNLGMMHPSTIESVRFQSIIETHKQTI